MADGEEQPSVTASGNRCMLQSSRPAQTPRLSAPGTSRGLFSSHAFYAFSMSTSCLFYICKCTWHVRWLSKTFQAHVSTAQTPSSAWEKEWLERGKKEVQQIFQQLKRPDWMLATASGSARDVRMTANQKTACGSMRVEMEIRADVGLWVWLWLWNILSSPKK